MNNQCTNARAVAFAREMEGRQYGEEETRDAEAWFDVGYNLGVANRPSAPVGVEGLIEARANVEANTENTETIVALRSEVDKLEGLLKRIAAVAHAGGAVYMTEAIALTEVRRMTLQVWDQNGDPEHIRSLLNDNEKTYE